MNKLTFSAALCAAVLALTACEKKGPVEQAGEEIDEAVDTIKHGEESPANKADDAMDDLRKGTENAKEEIKN